MKIHRKRVLLLSLIVCSLALTMFILAGGRSRGAIPFVKSASIWSIAIYSGPSPFHLAPDSRVNNPVLAARDVTDVRAEFVADPFMIQENGAWYMYFEVLNRATRQGDIGLATSQDGLTWKYQQIVLDEPFHLSYPYVFTVNGEHYMIPESYEAQSIRLYRADPFPAKWSLEKVLVECRDCVDSSIFQYQEKWWMFTSSTSNDVLRLFHANDLLGPWVEHAKRPLAKGNASVARPGGRVLVLNGSLFRFAQDNSRTYGHQLRAFEIKDLTTTAYREVEVEGSPILGARGSGWNKDGMHQIDAHQVDLSKWIACVDGHRQTLAFGFGY